MKHGKRLLSALLALAMLGTCLPTLAFAAEETAEEAEIRQLLSESVDDEEYPQGMFDFLTPRMETGEDVEEAEIVIVRRGNTDEEASVTFKAIDMTAEYGEDYTIEVPGIIFDKTLPENKNAHPLLYDEVYTADESTVELMAEPEDEPTDEATNEFEEESEDNLTEESAEEPADESEDVLEDESENEPADESEDEIADEPVDEATDESAEEYDADNGIEYKQNSRKTNTGTDLRSARTALTGAKSDYKNWREADEETVQMLSEAYSEMYDELEGVEYTIKFKPGEYMKKLIFRTIDDDISEDEEQVLFVLCHPENGAVSENPTGFMNIKDNDEPEKITFGFSEKNITVDADSNKAELIIERKTGLYRYGTVTVFSSEDTAAEGTYYDGFATEIAFVPGQTYKRIEIPIKRHPAVEDVAFKVHIQNSRETAVINIEHGTVIGENESGDDIVAGGGSNDVQLMGGNVTTNANIWNRQAKMISVSGNHSSNIDGGGSNDWFKFIISNSTDTTRQYKESGIDMSMVGKISFDHNMGDKYTKEDHWYWFTPNYYRGWEMWLKLDDSILWKSTSSHDWVQNENIRLSSSQQKSNSSITIGGKTTGKCGEAQFEFGSVKLWYEPIEIKIGMYDDDAMIQKKIYTSQNSAKDDGNAFLAGKLNFNGESASTTSKFFYNNDTVSFTEAERKEKDATYLWGIKFETKAGSTNKFFYYKGDSFSIKDLYLGKLKDVNGSVIGSTAKLTDKINGEYFTCYRIYPVYKQKVAYTTIKIDTSKSQFATGTFSNEQSIKTGVLDKIQINIAGKGDWAVSGFNFGRGNRYAQAITTTQTERELYDLKLSEANDVYKKWSPIYRKDSDWAKSIVNADASTPGSYLFSPLKTFNSLEALYQKPEISVAVNPRANSAEAQEQGFVAYMDENGKGQVAKYTGKNSNGLLTGNEIKIAPYKVGGTYQFIGGFGDSSETGYKFQWQDFTGDIDRNGQLSDEEIKALGNSYNNINKGVYAGDIFNYVPNVVGSPIVYFNIVPKSQKDTSFKNSLSGSVYLKTCSVIENSNPSPNKKKQPISGATIAAGGYTTTTDKNGKWNIEASEFDAGETYTATLAYGGRSYTGDVTVNRSAVDFVVDEYNTFNVKGFNAYQVTNDSEYENVEDWNLHYISNQTISNEDKRHLYTFKIDELIPTTAVVGRVEAELHGSDGTLHKTYSAIYNEDRDAYEIKDPALLEKYKDNLDKYNYSFNPATEGIVPGDYLTIRVYDQYDVGYIKHNIGFSYKPKLSIINIVNSFKSPLNPTLEFIGDVDMMFDLGLSAKLDSLDSEIGDEVNKKLTVTTTDEERTISYGWNKEFSKSYDSSEKKDDKSDTSKKNPESSEAPKTAAETVKEEASKLDQTSDKPDNEKTNEEKEKDNKVKDEAADTAKDAVDKKDDNKKSSNVTADLKLELSVAVELVMGYDSEENRYYFKDFVVTGVVSGEAGAKYEYTTPIGIVIFVKGELSGDITALLAIEPYYQNPAEPDYLYMDEEGTIDLTKLGNSDVNRQLSIYGKLMLRPKVTLSVGVSALSDKVASVSLNGSADFDMIFTTANDGAGNVTLSADLVLSILGGMVEKRWFIAKKKYEMFRINSGTMASILSVDDDYRYDTINPNDTDKKLYLDNRSDWNGKMNSDFSLMSSGAENYNEHILQTGAYPYAYPQIFVVDEGLGYDYSEATQIMFFLDSDETGTGLKYSIYKDGNWSIPEFVDDDGENDDTPQIEDLGDKLLVTWSTEGTDIDETDYVARLNSRDIKSVFFDKATMTFGDIQFVTKTTDADSTADDYASVAYYTGKNGKKSLMISYIKTLYEQSDEGELVVGDLLNAYSVIAYRFYDFENNEWVETYPTQTYDNLINTMSADDVQLFEENWYGQNFVDLSKYVVVDENGLLVPDDDEDFSAYVGCWIREPDADEISLGSLSSDPKIVEHEAITYDKYAVSAYLVDLDKSDDTLDDREIFLQFYDFENDKFYPAIRLTDDAYAQSYLTLEHVPDGVKLYYISDGNIVEQNIGNIVDNLIETTTYDGTDVLVYNKVYSVHSDEKVILEADENNPYTEFIVNSDNNNVYLTWTESGISFEDGVDRNSNDAVLPENYYSERQMYMAMETFEEYTYKDDNGEYMYYPETDTNGKTIDWSVTLDVNGNIGKVNAGDPIIKKVGNNWTKPVQMTDEQGAHYDDIDCVMIGNGILRCVYLKGMSEITDISGASIPVENTNNRALISSDFDFNVEKFDISFDDANDISAGAEEVPIRMSVKNESLITMINVDVELYMIKDGTEELIDNAVIDKISGGDSKRVTIFWDVPDEIDGITLVAYVLQGGTSYAEASETLDYDGLIEISDVSHKMIDRNTAEFTVSVKNSGSENAKNECVYINCGGVVSKSEEFDLNAGNTAVIVLNADIPEKAFEESRDETTITETAPLRIYTNNSIEDYNVQRSADASLEELMTKEIELINGTETYTDKITMKEGDLLRITSRIADEDEANYPLVNLVSDNDAIVSVTNGVLTAEKAGNTKITAEIYPRVDTYATNEDGYMTYIDTYNTLPSCLIKTLNLNVEVSKNQQSNKKSSHSSGGGSDTTTTTTAPTKTWFTDVSENEWYYDSVKYAFDNGLMVGVTDTEFAPETDVTRAMFVTVLYRMENEPDISNENLGYPFEDVDADSWYGDAVYWARLNGIVMGYSDEKFAPDDKITREQMAAIAYRYARFKEYDAELKGKLSYKDKEQISDYAKDAVIWCSDNGIMLGNDDNTFAPLKNTTRAQAAAVFERITEKLK
jgi:hypothetical protein